MQIAEVTWSAQAVDVAFDDGRDHRYLADWLSDNRPSARHRPHGQRVFDITALPPTAIAAVDHDGTALTVRFEADGGTERFESSWLYEVVERTDEGSVSAVVWGAGDRPSLDFYDFERLRSDGVERRQWLTTIVRDGFALVGGVPAVSESVRAVVELFGPVRPTNYGVVFDVRAEPSPQNLANTSQEIGLHTDNPYRDPVPGLQVLHCLRNDTDGGVNRLRDGFDAALALRALDPEGYDLLTRVPVEFRYVEPGAVDLRARKPLIEVDGEGAPTCVRYNSRSIQAFAMPPALMEHYYRAYRRFGSSLADPERTVEFRLEPGVAMIIDNHRILHARTGFSGGARHLQGCYADKDSLTSTLRVLEGRP